MKHVISHGLEPTLAKKAVEAAFRSYLERFATFKPVLTWRDDSHASVAFKAKGLDFTGRFALVPGALEVEMEVPMLFAMLKKQALAAIEEEVVRWVDLARAGKLP